MNVVWPTSTDLTNALLRVLARKGEPLNVAVLDQEVIKEIQLTEAQLQAKRSGNRTEIEYRLAWIRTKAKQNGFITRESTRVWKITEKGIEQIKF